MPILRLDNVSLAYGYLPLLSHVELQVDLGERLCVVGRNGAGKTTLFRVITGSATADEGEIWLADNLRVAHLEQEVPPDTEQTIFEVVAAGIGDLGSLLTRYHSLVQDAAGIQQRQSLDEMARLQARIESLGGWNVNQKVETVLTRLSLPEDLRLSDCSGGTRRQVMLARALVSDPDILLLDEPTNHLDINAITWLEKYLQTYRGALMFITHDRMFVRRLATRIVELDRGKLLSFPGDFDAYRRKKDELLEIEERAHAKFNKQLAEEEAWIRRGVKARRTRNEGRVKALRLMRREKAERLAAQEKARFGIDSGALSGKLVVDVRGVSFSFGKNFIIRDLSTRILRGDRVGIIGPNGSGKSTLLRLVLGELQPERGDVVLGTQLQVAYFDQHRRTLDPNKTVRENISDSDYVSVRGRSRHVIGYLKDFLFPAARVDSAVKALSGGERNRLLLAKIFTQSANMMVLDEPTNDLDVDTLELLEELLAAYEGTLLLVSHDRTFLDNVVTSTLVFEGEGTFREYAGGYEDWERYQKQIPAANSGAQRGAGAKAAAPASTIGTAEKRRRLSYKEQCELDELPARIEALEAEQAELHAKMADGNFYRQSSEQIAAAVERLDALKQELELHYERWQSLESIAGQVAVD